MLKILIVFLFPFVMIGQQAYQVTYKQISNGKEAKTSRNIIFQDGVVYTSKPNDKVQNYIDYNTETVSNVQAFDAVLYKTVTPFHKLPEPTFQDKPVTILGYDCKYAKYIYFSNTIEVWYTEKASLRGGPASRFLPTKNALVLKFVVNGNRKIIATDIKHIKNEKALKDLSLEAKEVSKSEFEELKINTRFTRLSVFENQIVNFDPELKNPTDTDLELNKIYRYQTGSFVLKKIKLTPKMKKSGFVFLKVTEKSNGDAYDRTGVVFIVPNTSKKNLLDAFSGHKDIFPLYTDATEKAFRGIKTTPEISSVIELMRFFTPFGVGHFNEKRPIHNYNWENEVVYKQEVSQVFPLTEDEVIIGVNIGNYDKGGHLVDVELHFYPKEEDHDNTRDLIMPLFSSTIQPGLAEVKFREQFKKEGLTIEFEVPKNAIDLELIYTVTGHGGWGTGDEFIKRQNQIYLDGKQIFNMTPWRADCASYRLSNPASGNFGNGLSSSDYSRSNWCPGTVTNPFYIALQNLKPGKHRLTVKVNQGEDVEGGVNFWGISGTLVGKMKQ